MSRVSPWFERKFEFTFPVEQYSNVCVRLWGTPARLEELLQSVPRETLVAKAGDKWSAQEHAGHLLDLEPLWAERVDDFLRAWGNADHLLADPLQAAAAWMSIHGEPIEDMLLDRQEHAEDPEVRRLALEFRQMWGEEPSPDW